MRLWLVKVLVVLSLAFAAGGLAQEPPAEAEATEATVRVERPPPGWRRGVLQAPDWLVLAIGGLVVAGAVAGLVARARRGR